MAETANERRERLNALRAEAFQNGSIPEQDENLAMREDDEDRSSDKEVTGLTFRNYRPRSKELVDLHVGGSSVSNLDKATAELRQVATKPQEEVVSLAPKKPNWDLKRDIETQMAILQNKTNIAIAKLAREIAEEGAESEEEN